nr:MAG TPA: hypothetical protein [Caudoviricetes sp.]
MSELISRSIVVLLLIFFSRDTCLFDHLRNNSFFTGDIL